MEEKLIAGYAAFTTADEYGAASMGDAPATTPLVGLAIASWTVSVVGTHYAFC